MRWSVEHWSRMAHIGKHRCSTPGCSGFDREQIYRRVKKHRVQFIDVLTTEAALYSVGMFANLELPELFMEIGGGPSSSAEFALGLMNIADYLTSLTDGAEIGAGTMIPAGVLASLPVWLWEDDARGYVRRSMGIARDYYRDLYMKRLEDVPVYRISNQRHPLSTDVVNEAFVPRAPGSLVERFFASAGA